MKRLISVIISIVFLCSCMGAKTPSPVASFVYGDDEKECSTLNAEISEINKTVATLRKKEDSKSTGNAVMVGVGLFLFWPAFFFMDFSKDEVVEINAYEIRKDSLEAIMKSKCK